MSGLDSAYTVNIVPAFNRHAPKRKSDAAPPFSLRLTFEERARLEKMAGGSSLGAYIRKRLFGDDAAPRATRQRRPTLDRVELARALSALGNSRLASNMNQIAKAIHNGTLPLGPELEADLIQACVDIQTMRESLMRALRVGAEDGPS